MRVAVKGAAPPALLAAAVACALTLRSTAQTEVGASQILGTVGYHQPPMYVSGMKAAGEWSWYESRGYLPADRPAAAPLQ